MGLSGNDRHLSSIARLFWLAVNLVCGLAPSVLFFVWVERGCSLPILPLKWNWPWIHLPEEALGARIALDAALFIGFGFLHTLFAQRRPHEALRAIFPAQALRTVYLAISGLALFAMMGFWQSTGTIVWAIPLTQLQAYSVSILVYWGILAVSGGLVKTLEPLEFLGLRQIYQRPSQIGRTQGTSALRSTGVYGWVRHPIYLFTLLAFTLAPVMTLDRLVLIFVTLIYLAVAIPIEERKLVAEFGGAYRQYQKRVPALFPFLRLFPRKMRA
jgi:protein-S-isoprenylcysteine O-methyltransferase Ste14